MTEASPGTKERILDAAERLFAERGIAATSLRAVIAAAGVNLAAVHYHFGSKEALVAAVVRRRIEPLNRQRLELLDQLERRGARRPPRLAEIVEAFLAPPLRFGDDPERGEIFLKLMGRLLAEPEMFFGRIASGQFAEVRDRFLAALGKALPHLAAEEIFLRLMFAIGAAAQAALMAPYLEAASGGLCRPAGAEETLRRLVPFVAGGLRAPTEVQNR
jgi:AcrR family transcriptional regulator